MLDGGGQASRADEPLPFRAAPHNLEAEQALLGAMLVNNEAHDRVSSFLEPDHFYDPLHKQIYEAAAKLIALGKQATPITLKTFFETVEPINAGLTVPQYLGRLAANAATIINARDYGRTIHDLSARRQMILIAEDMANAAYDAPVDFPPQEQAEEAQTRLDPFAAPFGLTARSTFSLDGATGEAIDRIDEAFRRGDGLAGLSTGIHALDALTGGLTRAAFLVWAGRPGMGKTSLATNVAFNNARAGVPVAFISLEMQAAELAMRILAAEIGVPMADLQRGRLQGDTMRRLVEARSRLREMPLHIEQAAGLSMPQIVHRLRQMRRKHKIDFAVIDYLQLINGTTRRRENRTQELTEITTGLKALAKELDIPILALSQLSREVEKREDKRPQLSDLRDSGSIEQDADAVAFVYREAYYLKRQAPDPADEAAHLKWQDALSRTAGKAEVILAKLRNGPTGTAFLTFDEGTMTFGSPERGGRL